MTENCWERCCKNGWKESYRKLLLFNKLPRSTDHTVACSTTSIPLMVGMSTIGVWCIWPWRKWFSTSTTVGGHFPCKRWNSTSTPRLGSQPGERQWFLAPVTRLEISDLCSIKHLSLTMDDALVVTALMEGDWPQESMFWLPQDLIAARHCTYYLCRFLASVSSINSI